MKPQLEENDGCLGYKLLCPACGFDYLHQVTVDVFNRREDESKGLHVDVEGDTVKINSDITGNPSPRRQGMVIGFTCEGCPARSSLIIIQHKGNTYVDFVVAIEDGL